MTRIRLGKDLAGQALVEFLFTSLGFIVSFTLVLSLAWLILTNYQIESQMQTGLICLSSQSRSVCEMNLKKTLRSILLWGSVDQIRSQNVGSEISLRLQYRWQHQLGLHFEKDFVARLQK